jgi:hypothetical protein
MYAKKKSPELYTFIYLMLTKVKFFFSIELGYAKKAKFIWNYPIQKYYYYISLYSKRYV